MKIIGIIAEYNPFHLGHLYQIQKIKEMYEDSLIIAIVSTNFTQRGDISIINKWDKTKICLENGIDLVVELPTLYATQSADIFAHAALKILNAFKIDTLVFGTETDDIETLYNLANTQLNNPQYDELVKQYLCDGINYPTAMSKALQKLTNTTIKEPNDLLGLSYIKEIIRENYPITPVSIKRTNNYHAKEATGKEISANLIRKLHHDKIDITPYVPNHVVSHLYPSLSINDAYPFLRYKIIDEVNNLSKYLTVEEGIEYRILKFIRDANTWQDLVMKTKTKRYTYNKINRMLIHILLGIRKEDNTKEIYLRILGFNPSGRSYLNKIKKEIPQPIYTHYKKNASPVLDLEFKSTYIYALITKDLSLILKEYKNKPIMK